jgi:hypothetical protein
MKALTNAVEALLGVAVLILAPLVLLVCWNHLTGSAFLQGCESGPLSSQSGCQFRHFP